MPEPAERPDAPERGALGAGNHHPALQRLPIRLATSPIVGLKKSNDVADSDGTCISLEEGDPDEAD
jgi:hypothetical protein